LNAKVLCLCFQSFFGCFLPPVFFFFSQHSLCRQRT
jgi:hypothetical protein